MTISLEAAASLIAAMVAMLALGVGGVAYLFKVERTLARIDTSLATFCGESQKDRTQLWKCLTESRDDHQELNNRVGILETKVSLLPTHNSGRAKPT